MISGIGIDIIQIDRLRAALQRHGEHFRNRVYTRREQACAVDRGKQMIQFYAGRWAAKEAVSKALGCGFGPHCGWLDIEVVNDAQGCPILTLAGAARETADRKRIASWQLSISHEKEYAAAMVLAVGQG